MKPNCEMEKAAPGYAPAVVMPVQFEEVWHGRQTPPEAALQLAMLEQAVMDVRRPRHSRERERAAREALQWVASDDKSWPFSFLNVCATFDLDPEVIRSGLTEERADVVSASVAGLRPTGTESATTQMP